MGMCMMWVGTGRWAAADQAQEWADGPASRSGAAHTQPLVPQCQLRSWSQPSACPDLSSAPASQFMSCITQQTVLRDGPGGLRESPAVSEPRGRPLPDDLCSMYNLSAGHISFSDFTTGKPQLAAHLSANPPPVVFLTSLLSYLCHLPQVLSGKQMCGNALHAHLCHVCGIHIFVSLSWQGRGQGGGHTGGCGQHYGPATWPV